MQEGVTEMNNFSRLLVPSIQHLQKKKKEIFFPLKHIRNSTSKIQQHKLDNSTFICVPGVALLSPPIFAPFI